ncbi:MAG: prolipoprotein diacylglyceryl transferase [Polyangiaceae bacterium]|nr:prolipoprotein diacylglyceryl transferase [Polyangiaceae bacterium]
MIPYIHVPDLTIGPLTLHPFGLLVATGVIVGTWLATVRARQRGVDLDLLNSFITWMLIGGFLGGHMLDTIFYHPDELRERPWSLLLLWEGLSSFGGFVGAAIGIVLWKYFEVVPTTHRFLSTVRRRRVAMPILPLADLILSVFPVAWILGRSGCAVVHDHPGAHASPGTLLAVAFGHPIRVERLLPIGNEAIELRWGTAPQFDLGLLELLFTIVLAGLIALTWRRKLTTGTYVAVTSLAYAPVRFAMDFLRVRDVDQADPRYGGLTPAQWACVALFIFGLVIVKRVRDIKASGVDPLDLLCVTEGDSKSAT